TGRVERAHANEPMRARLDTQGAESVGGVELDRGRLDARLLRVAGVEHARRDAVLFRVAQVHALQHLREVGRVDTAGAGTDRHNRGARVPLATEQRLHLELAEHALDV